MITVTLSNEILRYITGIDRNRYQVSDLNVRPCSKQASQELKISPYASNRIEGNPLSEMQVSEVIERSPALCVFDKGMARARCGQCSRARCGQ